MEQKWSQRCTECPHSLVTSAPLNEASTYPAPQHPLRCQQFGDLLAAVGDVKPVHIPTFTASWEFRCHFTATGAGFFTQWAICCFCIRKEVLRIVDTHWLCLQTAPLSKQVGLLIHFVFVMAPCPLTVSSLQLQIKVSFKMPCHKDWAKGWNLYTVVVSFFVTWMYHTAPLSKNADVALLSTWVCTCQTNPLAGNAGTAWPEVPIGCKRLLLHSNGVIAVWGTQVALASTSSHQQARALCAVRLLQVLQLFLLYGRTLITSTSAWGHIILRVFNWKLLLSHSELLSA